MKKRILESVKSQMNDIKIQESISILAEDGVFPARELWYKPSVEPDINPSFWAFDYSDEVERKTGMVKLYVVNGEWDPRERKVKWITNSGEIPSDRVESTLQDMCEIKSIHGFECFSSRLFV